MSGGAKDAKMLPTFCPVYVFYEDPDSHDLLYYAEQISDATCEPLSPAFLWGDANTPCPQNCPYCDATLTLDSQSRGLPAKLPVNPADLKLSAPEEFYWSDKSAPNNKRLGYPSKGIDQRGPVGAKYKPVRIQVGVKVINAVLVDAVLDGELANHPKYNKLWRISVGFESEGGGGPAVMGRQIDDCKYQCSVVTKGPEGIVRTYTVVTMTELS